MLKAPYYQSNRGQGGKYDLPEWLFDGVINEDVLHEQVLKGLIDRTLLEQQAGKLGMTVSDDTINRLLLQEEIFKDAEGNFSNDQFSNFLRQRGMTKNQLFAESANNW